VAVWEIVLIVLAALAVLFFVGGLIVERRRHGEQWAELRERIAHADRALEEARAADKGWDRVLLDAAAREALERDKPDFRYESLHLVLVDDKPGIEEDRALMTATGEAGEMRVVLTRTGEVWQGETVA
jgi:hypothetical protein